MSWGTLAAGVQITASSGACGRLATSAYVGCPSICRYFGFTAQTSPLKPLVRRLRQTVLPTRAGRSLAPKTATDAGSKNESM
jgi:hypothetical protein